MAALSRVLGARALPVMVGAGLFALVALWTFTVTPRYRSEALLEVQSERPGGGLADAVASMPGAPLFGLGKDELETQVGVLRSRRVLDAVMDSLGLTVRVKSPRVPRAKLVDVRAQAQSGPVRDVEGVITFRRDGARWTLTGAKLSPGLQLPASMGANDSLLLGDMVLRLAGSLAGAEPELRQFALEVTPRYLARRALLERLEVRRLSAGSQLIQLSLDDPDAVLAAAVLERMLAEYLAYTARTASGESGSTAAELRRQVAEQRERLSAAEEALRRYQEQSGVVMPSEQVAAEVKRYAALRGTLDQLEVERNALARLLALVEGRAGQRGDATAAYRQLATFPSLITNRAIQDLLLTLTTLENDRSELHLVRSDDNADVRQLTARIVEVEGQLQRLGRQYLESLDEQIVPTRDAIGGIDATLGALPEKEMRYLRLARESAVLNEGYLFLQKQLRQTELQDALRLDEVRVVDAPQVAHPDDPYFPRPLVNLVLGLVLALTAGGAVAAAQSALRAGAAAGTTAESRGA